MDKVMMKCGHAANATCEGKPSCAICSCRDVQIEKPDLIGRMAKCAYGCKPVPSAWNLAFFEFKGEGSKSALDTCKACNYREKAHEPEVMAKNLALRCKTFDPHGAFEFDRYYCGCHGWD